jgi:hypothetical protein
MDNAQNCDSYKERRSNCALEEIACISKLIKLHVYTVHVALQKDYSQLCTLFNFFTALCPYHPCSGYITLVVVNCISVIVLDTGQCFSKLNF